MAIIYRSGGQDQFFYDRHGGSYIDRLLLSGLEPLRADLRALRYRPTRTPFFERWMSGMALVDADARQVWFWSSQYPARSGLEHRLMHRLLSARWPEWTLRWLHRPAAQLARLLPDHPPEKCLVPVREMSPAAFAAQQDEAWLAAREKDDLEALIAEFGEATVRGWMELGSHQAAACVVMSGGGVHEVALHDGWDNSALLGTGPGALDALRARAHLPHEEYFNEPDIAGVYWIDPAARSLELWHGRPSWSEGTAGLAWEGWMISVLPGGPQEMMQRLGRSPRALLLEGAAERLRAWAERVVSTSPELRPLVEAFIAEEVAAALSPDR